MFSDEGILKNHAVDSADYISERLARLSKEIAEEINKEILAHIIAMTSVNITNQWLSPTTAT